MRYHFLEFTLDTDARALTRAGRPVRLSPKAFDLLALLVRDRNRAVGRNEIYDHLWPDTFVVEGNLPVLIREIRMATNQDAITTVHRTGYRFSAPVTDAPVHSVAVMRLVNKNGDRSLDYLADGVVDHVINRLAFVGGLRVMSRNATFRYEGTDAQEIGRELSVNSVMFGSLSVHGGQTTITIELVNVADRGVLLSRTYVRRDAEIASLPLRIAADVAEHFGTRIDSKEPATNAEAYHAYLHARECLARFDPLSLHQSIEWNERAVAADPNFAAAYSDLARAYLQLGIYFESPRERMPLALRHARRALDIDSTLADAHINLGVVHFAYEWDWAAAQRELFVTSELHPKTAEAFSCASHVLESAGHGVNAEHFIRRGLSTDPRSIPLLTELGCNSYAHRRYDAAIREFRDALAVDPRTPVGYWGLGRAYGQKTMYAEALDTLERVEAMCGFAPPIVASEIGYVLGRIGNADKARCVIDALLQQRNNVFVDPYLIATIHLGMDNTDQALDWLETAIDEKSGFAVGVNSEPKWDPLRSHSRFINVVQRVGPANS